VRNPPGFDASPKKIVSFVKEIFSSIPIESFGNDTRQLLRFSIADPAPPSELLGSYPTNSITIRIRYDQGKVLLKKSTTFTKVSPHLERAPEHEEHQIEEETKRK
jgi:hypothetical protein